MKMIPPRRRSILAPNDLAVLALLALLTAGAVGQAGGPPSGQPGGQAGRPSGLPAGVTREAMWPAPTAEDWKRPCLVTWQRTYEDAVAVSRETGKPILICVNMDGEIASEHYAGIRYRRPETASLYEPYVTVIASVYRHTPRDHDEEGRRILCPRFGSVTCGEHIAIEPGLYEKYFDGQRVAPRHIGVELDSKEMYDVFYAWDTDTIFNSLKEGIANRPAPPAVVRGDRSIVERVASRDVQDRIAVEKAYQGGDPALRRSLLEAALANGDQVPVDLLRLAVFGFDTELSGLARRVLAQSSSVDAVGLIGEALRVPMAEGERAALIAALERLGPTSPRARTLAVVQQGLASRSSVLDVESWSKALQGSGAQDAYADSARYVSRLENQDQVLASEDPVAHLELAEAFLDSARQSEGENERDAIQGQDKFERFLLMDAHGAALKAEKLGARGWRVNAAVAISAAQLGDMEEAQARAEAALKDPPDAADGAADGWESLAVLELFAKARERAIGKALRAKTDWPASWITDLHATYTVLARHPLATDTHVATHYDVLKWLGAAIPAGQFLADGLDRFPDSSALHDRLRTRLLEEKGVDGLETEYTAWLARSTSSTSAATASLEGFAGYASLVAAEFQRRAGNDTKALAAYDRGIAHYERAIELDAATRATSDHYIALALAGRARVALEHEDYERALAEVLACFARRTDSAATADGLGITPVGTAKMLLKRLGDQGSTELAAKLDAALAALDPELLLLPANERGGG